MDYSDGKRIVGSKEKSMSPMIFIPVTQKSFPIHDRRELIKQASDKMTPMGLGSMKRAQYWSLILVKLIFKERW